MAETHPRIVDPGHPLVEHIRSICMTYPEAVEAETWGRPTFRAGKKIFALFGSMDRPLSLVFKPTAQERLAYLEDAGFYVPKYWGPGGWMATELSDSTDWAQIAELVDTSYRQVALKRQITALDARV